MHRKPNNAQNTQHKLGVAFSYLERNKGSQQCTDVSLTTAEYFTGCSTIRYLVRIMINDHLKPRIQQLLWKGNKFSFAGQKMARPFFKGEMSQVFKLKSMEDFDNLKGTLDHELTLVKTKFI